ncbi:hypothetical protein H257_02764 [Aphanomyces astaci]|uniref:WRKY19-like zinc finger domain-containing protein n=1 Tax=Aphanomyces astaci TaxID=112090 RepID=W4H546_APHAT|nr:hypothetical protein H257_02764 [Aphanomyces astaci]ETV86389.1 hypothetical protein H257_02764 [Aphanomyces astaci]|eukprot:XP_009824861.1 hypothetical protein H257_02764 [Aphanomyces astaci]
MLVYRNSLDPHCIISSTMQHHQTQHNFVTVPNNQQHTHSNMSPTSPSSSVASSEMSTTTPTAASSSVMRRCTYPQCDKKVRSKGLCKAHGGGIRCLVQGCNRSSQGKGYCIRHGGGKRCSIAGCNRSSQSNGLCKSHGGGLRCQVPHCDKSSQGGGYCRLHGGGHRCQHDQCEKGAQRGGYCAAHGGNRACQFPDCVKNDRGGGYCAEHGGGRRCTTPSCNKPARKQGKCSHHAPSSLAVIPPMMYDVAAASSGASSLDGSFGQSFLEHQSYHHQYQPPSFQAATTTHPHNIHPDGQYPRNITGYHTSHNRERVFYQESDLSSNASTTPRGFSDGAHMPVYFTKAEPHPNQMGPPPPIQTSFRYGSMQPPSYEATPTPNAFNHPGHHQGLSHQVLGMHPSVTLIPDPLPYPYPEQRSTALPPSMLMLHHHPPTSGHPPHGHNMQQQHSYLSTSQHATNLTPQPNPHHLERDMMYHY